MTEISPVSIVVLSSPGHGHNPTVTMLMDGVPAGVEFLAFTWRRAFLSRWDILHLHWPEYLIREDRPAVRLAKRAAFAALLLRLRFGRRRAVWTVHNERPHDGATAFELWLLERWRRVADTRVFLYASALPEPADDADVVILRGDYEPLFGAQRDAWQGEQDPTRLLLFGFLRPYKGVEELLAVAADAPADLDFSLRVVGQPVSEDYGRLLTSISTGDPRIDLVLGFADDDVLVEEIMAAGVVVLPYLRMYNSGAALLALSLGRPVLVASSPTMLELQAEVGPDWVQTFEGPVTTETLSSATEFARRSRTGRPVFGERDWVNVGRKYSELYASLIGRRGRR